MDALIALSDATRRRIVELLAERERTAGEIVAEFKVTPPAISQHLKVLREARLINVRIAGQRRIQSLNHAGLVELEAWLSRTKAGSPSAGSSSLPSRATRAKPVIESDDWRHTP